MELGNGRRVSFASGPWAIPVADCVSIEPADALRPGAAVAKQITNTQNTSRRDLIDLLTVELFLNRVPLAASAGLGSARLYLPLHERSMAAGSRGLRHRCVFVEIVACGTSLAKGQDREANAKVQTSLSRRLVAVVRHCMSMYYGSRVKRRLACSLSNRLSEATRRFSVALPFLSVLAFRLKIFSTTLPPETPSSSFLTIFPP